MMSHDDTSEPLSKTKRKQAMEDLQSLGAELVDLPTDKLKRIEIEDELRNAVAAAQKMPRNSEAKRRQMQFIGKLMRSLDAEPIRAALAHVKGESAAETAKLHRIEKLRNDLIADEKVLSELVTTYPGLDLQHLRALRRSAIKEQLQNKPPKSYRAIFQLLKALESGATETNTEEDLPEDL